MKKYKLVLRPLTAVHIGTGDTISPIEYKIVQFRSGKKQFAAFSPESVIELLSEAERNEFYTLTEKRRWIELRKFIRAKVKEHIIKYVCEISDELAKEFSDRLEDENNSLEVEVMYRNSKNPVVPGSSIKGAIRTAILNERRHSLAQQEQRIKNAVQRVEKSRDDSYYQQIIMSSLKANDDPLRMYSIGDCTFVPKNTQLVGKMVQYHLQTSAGSAFDNKAALYAEVIKGELINKESIAASGDFIVHDELDKFFAPDSSRALREKAGKKLLTKPVSIDELFNACNTFYNNVFDKEYNKIIHSSEEQVKINADKLAERIDAMSSQGETLIRIGRWSHIEAVTVDEEEKSEYLKHVGGKSRTLLMFNNDYYQMGWCAIKKEPWQ